MGGEVWKEIKGLEGIYSISNYGRIKAHERYVRVGGGGNRKIEEHCIKPTKCTNGYLEVHFNVAQKRSVKLLHRVVAEAFIPNPDNLPEVNHKDEDISNCRADNLEWCTSKYNANYGTRNIRMMLKREFKPVRKLSKDGQILKTYGSIAEASKDTGADVSAITRVCKGIQKTSMGFRWEYAN